MYSFKNDYSEGAHPRILEALVKTNLEQQDGYGEDDYCIEATNLIKNKIGNENIDVHYISGGTQTNLIAIASFLRPHEACISANTGHIFVNEAGAIECVGHKVITVDSKEGKISRENVEDTLKKYINEHVVKPKLVYISNSTELGTIYKKSELEQLREVCDDNNLILYMDGARLGSALCCSENDLTLGEIAKLTDAFYIGGTKNGALLGEALVITNDKLKEDFRYHLKQRGAMLAKGRILGIQFKELFKENLFFDIATYENNLAQKLREAFIKLGYEFLANSPTNQLFPVIPNDIVEKLSKEYDFIVWRKLENNMSCIRLITSFATKEEKVEEFISCLNKLHNDIN